MLISYKDFIHIYIYTKIEDNSNIPCLKNYKKQENNSANSRTIEINNKQGAYS